jgi:hypothetical protein
MAKAVDESRYACSQEGKENEVSDKFAHDFGFRPRLRLLAAYAWTLAGLIWTGNYSGH